LPFDERNFLCQFSGKESIEETGAKQTRTSLLDLLPSLIAGWTDKNILSTNVGNVIQDERKLREIGHNNGTIPPRRRVERFVDHREFGVTGEMNSVDVEETKRETSDNSNDLCFNGNGGSTKNEFFRRQTIRNEKKTFSSSMH
jgi:hypothetical protein